jgi:DNA polymerase-3 subunit delta
MKITPAQTNSFLQKPDPTIRIVLIYGPDAGLVRERAEMLAKKTVPDINDPFRTASLTGSSIADDPARLADEVAAQAFGGGTRLVRIQSSTESIAAPLKALLEDYPGNDSLLIIEGGDLDKRSKLRALCEASPLAAVLACYVEEGAARQKIIGDILQAEQLTIARDAMMLLADALPPDRIAMRSELDKLAMYVGKSSKQVTIDDVRAVIQDAGAAEIDDLIMAIASGEAKRAMALLDRLLEEQTSPVALLRAAQRHFLRLQIAQGHKDKGGNAEDAIGRLQPPVFWKYKSAMTAQLNRWSRTRIETALSRLFEAEAAVKRTGTPDDALTAQLLLSFAA